MSAILLPQRFLSQPQYPAQIDYAGLGKGAQLLFNPAAGPIDLATGRVWTPGGNASIAVEPKGKVFSFDGVDDYYAYTGYPEITSNVGTFFAWLPRVGAPDDFGHVYFGASSPVVCGHQVNSSNQIFIGTGSGASSGSLSSWFNSINRSLVLISNGTAAGTKAFVDGVDTGFTFSSPPTAWGVGNKNFNLGRYVGASTIDFSGSFLTLGMTSAVWGAAEAKAFHQNPWLLFKAPSRLFLVATPGGDAVTGSVAYANVDDDSSATASTTVTGSSSTTNASDISAASGATTVTTSSSTTNVDDVSNAVVTSETETVTATVAVTNTDDASTAIAAPEISASSGTTNANDVSGGLASPVVSASAANTSADDVSVASASAGSEAAGSVAYTNIDDVSESALVATIKGSVAYTNFGDISAAVASGYTSATASSTNADDVGAAFASPVVSGALATANADDVSDATAIAEAGEVTATVDTTNANDVSAAVCAPIIVGTVAYSNLHDFSAAVGVVNFGTIVETGLTTGIVESARVKKPGIPANAPQWQKTMFEIMTGRRGNKIDVAAQQNLTFSATPTKEECEALYSYLSDVHKSMNQLINRFDS